jgi:hypothetical protein
MAWRGFRFGIQHLFRDRGYANMSIGAGSTIASGDFLSFCFDERREKMTFTAAAASHEVRCDTGATPIACGRVVIPAGHGSNGKRIKVQEADNPGWVGPIDRLWIDPTDDNQLDATFVTATSERYVRVAFQPTSGTVNPTIAELWLTTTLTPDSGPDFRWRDSKINNVASFVTPAGDRGDIQLGAQQRVFELEYPFVDAAADITILDQLVDDVGMDTAFILDPPFDDEDALICKMLAEPQRSFAHSAPNSGSGKEAYSYRFSIIEQIV